MSITSIQRDQNNNVSIVRITVDTDLSAVIVPNYITSQQDNIYRLNKGTWIWFETDTLLISGNDANAFFEFTDLTFSTIEKIAPSPNGIVNPGLINQVAYYAATGNEVSGRRSSAPNIIYLAPFPYGSDSGDGSILAPFATLSHAMSTITTASPTNLFEIRFQMGSYTDSSVALKPYVNVNGQGSSLSISGSITADASWSSGGSIQVGNFDNISTSISIYFDVSSSLAQCNASFYNMKFSSNNSVNIFGGNLILVLDTLYSFSGDLNVYVENAYGAINSSSVLNFTYLAWNTLFEYNFQVSQSYVFDTCNFSTSSGAMGISSYITASKLIGTLNATGTNTNLFIDCASLTVSSLPNILGGAVVQYINVANTLTANYSPVNYIPDASGSTSPATSVAAHLHGIDNFLSSIPISVLSNAVYVSVNGNNTSGNGSVVNPFLNIGYAMSSITTASSTNPFTIILLDGIYNEASFLLKPNVNIIGANAGIQIILSPGALALDPSWNSGENSAYYANFILNGYLTLDFTSFPGASSPIIQLNNLNIGNLNLNGGISIPYVTVYECYFSGTAVIDNANYISWSNNYSGGLNAGLNTVVSPLYYFSISDLYTSANLSGADTGTYSSQYNINSSQMGSIYLYGSLTSLSIDSASYITPVIVSGTPTINLLTISDGILANYTPLNYTPSSAPPTLSTSLQANLQGIDNVLANFNTGNKSLGTTTNDNAVAGHVGEYISNSSTGVSLSTGTAATITSINLPAGDWDVSGAIEFIPNGITTVQQYISSISKTANTLPTVLTENNIQSLIANFTTGSTNILNCGATRISIAFTTTVYLVGRSAFGVSTMTASGFIGARRVR